MRGLLAPLIKLAVFLVVTIFATYVLGVTIANSSSGSTKTYKADFSDVTGLNLNDDVRIAGVRVGSIEGIALEKPDKTHRQSYSQITFTVDDTQTLPKDVEAKLRYRNLVGQRYLDIEQGAAENATSDSTVKEPALQAGATIPMSQTTPAVDLTVLFNGFTNLAQGLAPDQINKLSYALIQTLQGEGGALENLLGVTASLTNKLADNDQLIGDVIDNLTSVLQTLDQRDTELSNLIIQLRRLLSGLAGDRYTIGNAIGGINDLTKSTSGLLTQIRDPLKKDIVSLNGLVSTLNDNGSTLQYVIKNLPTTVGPLIRTASYGSWFNFYLCQATVGLRVGNHKPIDFPVIPFGSKATNVTRGCQ